MPFYLSKSEPCLASIVVSYIERLKRFLPDLGPEEPLFHQTRKDGTVAVHAFGPERLAAIGREVATLLDLDSPEAYSSDCLKCPLKKPSHSAGTKRPIENLEPENMREIRERYIANSKRFVQFHPALNKLHPALHNPD